MPKNHSTSLVNLGELSKPADTLIKKVSAAVGGMFEPLQIERVAKAQAKADLIKVKSDIEINLLKAQSEREYRAMRRFIGEQAQHQENMEKITAKAVPQLEDSSDPSQIEDDWITNFFAKSRIVSDDEMQQIWAKVLAGEANAPGTFSKRTVNFLGDLDKKDAELFQNLCSFGLVAEETFTPLIFDSEADIYNDKGINFETLTHLDSIGLIQLQSLAGFVETELPKSVTVLYCGQPLLLEMPKNENNTLPKGKVLLTQVGRELVLLCKMSVVEGFYDYVKEQWKRFLPKAKESKQDSGGKD